MEVTPSIVSLSLFSLLIAGWLFSWILVARHWQKSRQLLHYDERKYVPWDGVALIVIVFLTLFLSFVVMQALGSITGKPLDTETIAGAKRTLLVTSFSSLLSLFLSILLLRHLFHATAKDFGIPQTAKQWRRLIRIGLVALCASTLPILAVQALLVTFWFREDHPIVKMAEKFQDPGIFLLSCFTAILVAPITEEFLFRCLLQGWLEKKVDQVCNTASWREESSRAAAETYSDADGIAGASEDRDEADHARQSPASRTAATPQNPYESTLATDRVLQTGSRFQLVRAFIPIAASAFLFAAAHLGHGPAPIPLLILGLLLGYLYRQTHSLVPCVVLHMAFNSVSMILLLDYLRNQ